MPVERMLLMSRVPVYWTLAPVWSSHGFTIAMKDSCSVPVHVPMTETEPPSWAPPDADAAALSPAPALAGGALAGVDASGLALELPLEQATAINMTANRDPATFVRRTIRSSIACLLSRRPLCPGSITGRSDAGRGRAPVDQGLVDGAVEARTMSSVGSSVLGGISRSAIRSRSARPAACPSS